MDFTQKLLSLAPKEKIAMFIVANKLKSEQYETRFEKYTSSTYFRYLKSARQRLGISSETPELIEQIKKLFPTDESVKETTEQPKLPSPPNNQVSIPRWMFITLLVSMLLICIVGVGGGIYFIASQYSNIFNPLPTFTPLPYVPPPPTSTFTPTITLSPTITLTPTSSSTPTLTFTPTITKTFTPEPEYLFNTTFADHKIPDGLNRESGDLNFNERGMTTYGQAIFTIGDSTWTDYMVEMFVSGTNTCDKGVDLGVRESSPASMMMVVYRNCNFKWVNLLNGKYQILENTDVPPADSRRIFISVKGDQYNSFSFKTNSDHPTGGIYVTMVRDVTIEYIKVIKLP